MIIAIDGPAGAGKSTVARRVAEALGIRFLDTGAMYRAVTLRAREAGLDPRDDGACGALAERLDLAFDEAGAIRIDGEPGEPHIRSEGVNRDVSDVSALPRVRRAVVAKQRALAGEGSLVAEGRDTTTVVFPDADHKFYLDASPEERARRRALQEGRPERRAELTQEMAERDRKDSSRVDSPLLCAEDAVRIDTDGLDLDGVVRRLLAHVGS